MSENTLPEGTPKEPVIPAPDPKERVKQKVAEKAHRFHRLFSTALGKEVLQDLEDEFNKDYIFVPGQQDVTDYNLGGRDVIIYIQQLMRFEENNARKR